MRNVPVNMHLFSALFKPWNERNVGNISNSVNLGLSLEHGYL